MRQTLSSFVYVVYCFVGGLFLLLGPWTIMWRRGALIPWSARFEHLLLHPVARGALSGLGLALLLHVIQEVAVPTVAGRQDGQDAHRDGGR